MNLFDKCKIEIDDAANELIKTEKYTQASMRMYKFYMKNFLRYADVFRYENLSELPEGIAKKYVQNELSENPKRVSQVKNALRVLGEIFPTLEVPGEEFYIDFFKKKGPKTASKNLGSGLTDPQLKKKINSMRKGKLRMAYKVTAAAGLRISETSELKGSDFKFINDEQFEVTIDGGKGGKNRVTTSVKDKSLVKELKALIESSGDDKLFLASKTLQNNATKRGFECHDLRRFYSRRKDEENRADGMTRKQAFKDTKKNMNHVRNSTTRHYQSSGASGR